MTKSGNIQRNNGVVQFLEEDGWHDVAETAPVSMNFWGFTPDYFTHSLDFFKRFLSKPETKSNPKAEFFIPLLIDELINNGTASVEVLPTTSQWFGVTYPEDRPAVVEKINTLIESGIYPKKLF